MSARTSLLSAWKPAPGDWDATAVQHLFRRAAFGATPEQAAISLEQGLGPTLDELFADDTPETGLHRGILSLLPRNEVEPLQAWWMALILSGQGAWRERLALVWHNHFATSFDKVDDVRLMHRQNELFRSEGSGDFRRLLHAIARDTAMLLWLDGDENKLGHPNENFAREVMELFGLGIGNYTEEDIREAARALTGWGTRGRSSVFREHEHDPGTKRFLGREGRLGAEDVVDAVLAQPACPRHVARRLLVEYVSPEPQPDWIDALAGELLSNDWDVGRTLRTLLASELFFSPVARRSRIASPVELVATSARALEVSLPPRRAAELAASMGQALFRPPSVKGWDGHQAWINVGTWIARHNAMVELVEGLEDDGSDSAELARRTRETLLPGIELDHLDDALRRTARRSGTPAKTSAALVLTAPEHHFS